MARCDAWIGQALEQTGQHKSIQMIMFFHSLEPNKQCKRRRVLSCLLAALACFSHPDAIAQAQAYACHGGSVGNVTLPPSGLLNVSISFENGSMLWQNVCSVNGEHRGISSATCRAMHAVFLSANLGNKPIIMWFNHPSQSCANDEWSDLSNRGWYWGPAILKN